jgi:hypothetical protein
MSSLIGTMKLDPDASCNINGPNLSSDLTPCFLVPIITIKHNKLVTMEAQAFLDSSDSTCFIDKKLV